MDYGLYSVYEKRGERIPLKTIDIFGDLMGEFLHVKIVQSYENNRERNGEFIYKFPLPDKASVCGFVANIGEKVIKGRIKEKKTAYQEYEEAVEKGNSALLLERFTPNVFQVSLGQVERGEKVEIEIAYLQEVKIIDGEMRISVPTLIAPRYIPENSLPAGEDLDAGLISPQIREVDCKVCICFNINPGRRIASLASPSHNINVSWIKEDMVAVSLAENHTIPDRDFVLKTGVLGEEQSRCIIGTNQRNEHYLYAAFTPELPQAEKQEGTEYIFLIDVSGSMAGEKLKQAKTALNVCLRNLDENDSFNLVAFESTLHLFSSKSQRFNQHTLKMATAWVKGLVDMGGTEILPAIKFALKPSAEERKVVMLFTDGQVGNEKEILQYVENNKAEIRIFSVGIDTSVNSRFINEIAEAGNGWAEMVYPGESLEDKIIRQFSRIHGEWMDHIKVLMKNVRGFDISGGMPARLYDLEPYSILAKLEEKIEGGLVLEGMVRNERVSMEINELREVSNCEILEKLWAKSKIEEMERYLNAGNPRRVGRVKAKIINISETHGVLSSLTSYTAVYERENRHLGLPETVIVPVSPPAGWDCIVTETSDIRFSLKRSVNELPLMGGFSGCEPSGIVSVFDKFLETSDAIEHNARLNSRGLTNKVNQLAAGQNYDGSFGKIDGDVRVKIVETVKALAEFITGSSITLFRRQIRKALNYLLSKEEEIIKETPLLKVVYMIIKLCITLKIITHENGLRKTNRFHRILNERMELDELTNDRGEVDVKYLVQLSQDL